MNIRASSAGEPCRFDHMVCKLHALRHAVLIGRCINCNIHAYRALIFAETCGQLQLVLDLLAPTQRPLHWFRSWSDQALDLTLQWTASPNRDLGELVARSSLISLCVI